MHSREQDVSLVAAAMSLGLGYHRTLNAVLRGELKGWKDGQGRWRVATVSIESYRTARRIQTVAGQAERD